MRGMPIPAASRRWLDPATRDYVVERGGPRPDATRASKVLLRLTTRRGSCAVAPTLGSRLHLIRRDGPGVTQRAEAYALEAVDDLVKRREIREVTARADVTGPPGNRAIEVVVFFREGASDPRSVRTTHRIGA